MLEEVVEEVVDYEPWMDDYGRQPAGVELDAEDGMVQAHPELWLSPEVIEEITREEREKELEAARKKDKQKYYEQEF